MSGSNDLSNTPMPTPPEPRPLRTWNDVVWKDAPTAPATPADGTPPVEIDPYTGLPKPRPLRTWNQVQWKK